MQPFLQNFRSNFLALLETLETGDWQCILQEKPQNLGKLQTLFGCLHRDHRIVTIISWTSYRAHCIMSITLWPSHRDHSIVTIVFMTITLWPSKPLYYDHHTVTIESWPSNRDHRIVTIALWTLYREHCIKSIASWTSYRDHRIVSFASWVSHRNHRIVIIASNSKCPHASVLVTIQQSQWLPILRLCPSSCLSYPDANSQRNLTNERDVCKTVNLVAYTKRYNVDGDAQRERKKPSHV